MSKSKPYGDQKCFVCKTEPARAHGRCNKCDAYWRRNNTERPSSATCRKGNFKPVSLIPGLEWRSWFMA